MNAFDLVCSHPWAITEDALSACLEIAQLSREQRQGRIEALTAKAGEPLQHTHTVTTRDGVATIPVEGPLFRHANLMTQLSGATSTGQLATDLQAALENPRISAIMLDIDSPGGEVNGTSEFAQQIYDARGSKPIVAYVSNQASSAAYWIASACDEIVMADTAFAGSIGCVASVRTPVNDGRSLEFVSSQSPNKRLDPTTDTGRGEMQDMVDHLADVFIETVARNRGTDPSTVLDRYGQGGVMVGAHAVAAGLADRLGTYEGLHAELASRRYSAPTRTPSGPDTAASAAQPLSEETMPEETIPTTEAADEVIEVAAETPTPDAEAEQPSVDTAAGDPVAELTARLAALEAERDAQAARAAAAESQIAALLEESKDRELFALASEWFGDPAKHVTVLKALEGDAREFYVQTQNAHMEQLRASVVLKQQGTSNPTPALTAGDRIEQLASAKRAENPKLTPAKARAAVIRENPALYEEYERETRATV